MNARAQVQERKLMDRLLKPDTALQNNAQGKQYQPGGHDVAAKKTASRNFYTRQVSEKEYPKTGNLTLQTFSTNESRLAHQRANITSDHSLTTANKTYATTTYSTTAAHDARKTVATADYPKTRPFLVRGKSQKALNTHNQPMTIDEVRELLNKNK